MKLPLYRLFFLLLLGATGMLSALAQGLEGTIELAPPHPNNFDYYRDLADNGDLFISLTNTGAAAREIYVLATIRRGGSVFAAMDPAFRPTVPIRLEPMDTRDFDGGTLRELNLRFTQEDVTGVNATELDAILRFQMLPPAEYSLCIRAYDFATGARININGAPEICTIFEIADPGYAELLTPEHNEVIDVVDGDEDVFISWAYNGFSGGYDIRYRLKVVDLTEQAVLPELATIELMSSGVPAIYETDDFGLGELSYTYGFDATDYRLVPGHQYAVRVTAFEADDLLVFPQGGHSQVHVFTYGSAGGSGDCDSPDYQLTARYPLTGDTIPFNFTPCVAQVEPLCDEYRRFDFDFTLSQNGGPTYSRADRNVWTRLGPHGYLENLLGHPVTRERASHFVFNLEAEQTAAIGPLEAGGNYSWNTSSTMRSASGATYTGASSPQNFVHGMPRPRLASPADEEVIAPGTVNLVWQSGQAPGQLLPEHLNLIRAERSEVVGYESVGGVFEAYVVQVARGRDFSEAEMVGGQKVELRLTDLDQSADAIAAALYREMRFSISVTDTGTYYWRVVWLKDITYTVPANGYLAAGRSYHDSPTRRFRIGAGGRDGGETPTVATTPDDSECESTCVTDLPASTSPRSILLVGDSVRLGRFTLVPTEVSGDGSGFSGSGTIHMPFMNDLRVMVNFSGIRINGAGEAFAGSAKAVEDPMPFDIIAGTGLGSSNPVPSVSPDQLGLLNAAISGAERLVSGLTDRRAIGLPLGFDRELGGYQAILGIVAMDFTPTAADLDIVCSLELPEFGGYIGLGIGDWCFKPSGLGTGGRLYVPQDIPLNPGEDIVFKISGGAASDSTNITYAEFDCSGMTCLQLRGELEFDRSIILPDTTTITDPDAKVTASLRAKVCVQDGFDLLVEGNMPSFIAPGADNFTWEESSLWVDLSDRENPTGMDVPTGYRWPAEGRARDTWKGIYIPRVMMRMPDQLDGDGPPATVGVDHFIIDFAPAAISFRVAAYNVVGDNSAHIDGWGVTIDTLYAALIQTRDLEAGIVGRIQMPIADTGTHLLYRAALNTRGLELGVSVDPTRPFGVPIMAAQLTLKPNTFLKIALPFGSSPYIEAQLNGTVTITGEQADQFAGGSSSGPGMNLPGVNFDDVYFHTGSGTSRPGTWAFASPQKQAAGFPLSIEDMGLDLSDWEHPGFFIRPRLTIMSGSPGIAGEAELRFYGTINTEASGIKKIGLDRVALTEISIEANISKIKLAGYIRWRKTGTVDEVAGGLDVTIPMGIRGKMECTFGTYRAADAAPLQEFNTDKYHSYWQVNGLLQFNPGLQIFSGFALYGLGGGASYHMERSTAASFSEIRSSPKLVGGDSTTVVENAPNPSSATYIRDFTKGLGLELTVMLGTYPKADVFNMDVSLSAMFLPAGGLARFTINGDGYVMTGIDDRESDKKMVWASVNFLYDATQDLVDGRFKVFLNVKEILVGQHPDKSVVDAHFYSSPVKWFFQVGTYTSPGGIKLVVGDKTLADLKSYLMVGHDVPAELPEVSDPMLRALLYGGTAQSRGAGGSVESDEAGAMALQAAGRSGQLDDIATGIGFAFGTSLVVEADINPIPFYLDLRLALGMDVFVAKIAEGTVCAATNEPPGINGWRGGGQVYAGMWGKFGIGVTLIRELKIPIVELAAGFVLQAEVPNPNYFAGRAAVEYSILGGLKEGRKTVSFEFGEKCDPINTDPLANITLLEDLQPTGNQTVYARAAATFSLPINRMLEIPRTLPTDGTPPTFYKFWPFIASWTIKTNTDSVIACEPWQVKEAGYVAYLEPTAILPPNRQLKTEIVLKFRDYTDGSTGQVYRRPGDRQDHQEDSLQRFRTGNLPTVIAASEVKYTYPLDGQRHYLPEVSAGKGTILLSRDHSPMLYTEREGRTYSYLLRYIPLSATGEPVDVSIASVSGRQFRLPVPTGLQPATTYAVQFLRIKQQTQQEHMNELMASAGVTATSASPTIRDAVAAQQAALFTRVRENLGSGDYTNNRQTRRIAHSEVTRPEYEFKLYQWYFRTSEHQSLEEKLADLSLTGQTPHAALGNRGAYARGTLAEHFDEIEVYGHWWRDEHVVKPLIQFNAHVDDDYYVYHNRYFYSAAQRLAQLRSVNIDISPGIRGRVFLPGRFPQISTLETFVQQWTRSYYLDESRSWVLPRLQPGEISSSAMVTLAPGGNVVAGGTTGAGAGAGTSGGAAPGGFVAGVGAGSGFGSGASFGGTVSFGGSRTASGSSGGGTDWGTGSSGPNFNFGLTFQAPQQVFQDRVAVANHVNYLLGLDFYYLLHNSNLYTGTVRRNEAVPGEAHRISMRDALSASNRATYVDMLQLQWARPWDYIPFSNLTPPLPQGSEFAQQQSNRYHLTLRYMLPASLGRESVERDYLLNNVPLPSTGVGPH